MLYRRPQTVIFRVFKQAGLNTISYRKGWKLPQAGLNLLDPQKLNCDINALSNKLQESICKRVGIFEQAVPKLIISEWGGGC